MGTHSVGEKSQTVAAGASLMIAGEENSAQLLGASSSGFRYGCVVSPCRDGTFLSRDGTFLAERGSESALFYSRFATNDDKLGTIVNQKDFKSMSTDELWALHEEVVARLATSLLAEKRLLEDRLKQLKGVQAERTKSSTGRRPYPTVVPKFRNPDRPSETWAGRGKTPRWLAAKLKSGKRIDDFRIRKVA